MSLLDLIPQYGHYIQDSKLNLCLGTLVLPDVNFRRTAEILEAQLKILGTQLTML